MSRRIKTSLAKRQHPRSLSRDTYIVVEMLRILEEHDSNAFREPESSRIVNMVVDIVQLDLC